MKTDSVYVEGDEHNARLDTQPRKRVDATSRRPKRTRRSERNRWRVLSAVLASVVALNVCLVSGFWLSRSGVLAALAAAPHDRAASAGTAVSPLEVLLTALPGGESEEVPQGTPMPTAEPARGVVTILLLGIDARPNQEGEPTRSDAMMVVRANFDEGTIHLLSLPRDMWVALPLEDRGIDAGRINTAYFFGERYDLPGGGPALAMETVSLNFGIPIDHYALIDFDGFVRVVDALGGIDVDVPKAIYDDIFPTDDYGITLLDVPAGQQHLDGITALRYARTRHQDTDFERTRRQQAVLLAVRDKAISLDAVVKLPELLKIAGDSLKTDLSLAQMISYAVAAQQIGSEGIETFVIDETLLIGMRGRDNASLYLPNREKLGPLIADFLS